MAPACRCATLHLESQHPHLRMALIGSPRARTTPAAPSAPPVPVLERTAGAPSSLREVSPPALAAPPDSIHSPAGLRPSLQHPPDPGLRVHRSEERRVGKEG